MTIIQTQHPGADERVAIGKAARERVPRSAHRGWTPAPNRPDPVATIEAEDADRDQDLVPVRHGRMVASPFTFYRGGARIMAIDLADTPRAGLDVQLCGDAHLSNFGLYASPERNLVFDLNDFDETLRGPFEYDVARLAASVVVAGRNNGFPDEISVTAVADTVAEYRIRMGAYAEMGELDIWYSSLSTGNVVDVFESLGVKKDTKSATRARATMAKAATRDRLHALSKLGEVVDGQQRIVSDPPLVVPLRDMETVYGFSREAAEALVQHSFRAYRSTLEVPRRRLLDRYQIVDTARKVVGVGSVGTRAFIALLQGRDEDDPLFLQVKEAGTSVLEDHLPASTYLQNGRRVVEGQRAMQAVSDVFLGWSTGTEGGRHFYWRQLRDMKGSATVETMNPKMLATYGRLCGWALARAHARTGDSVAIAAYLGKNDRFDRAMVDFSWRYADQNDADYERFAEAIRSGRLEAVTGI
jgi:uncharacterized protein (DUF2252 family)